MRAIDLYRQLESDFIKPGLSDQWAQYMTPVNEFLTANFRKRSMGLVCDNTPLINSVYTAVFPTRPVLQDILDRTVNDSLLFVHHPEIWDPRRAPQIYQQMDIEQLRQFQKRRISIYNLHVPLDNYGKYSTGVSLANVLGLRITRPFAAYYGALAGVVAVTSLTTVRELWQQFNTVMGHRTSLYPYGAEKIKDGLVAIAAGGGNLIEILQETRAAGINTYMTGVTVRMPVSEASHLFAAENGLNLLGGTHYSTEKPACQAICAYFRELGLPAEFVEGEPNLEDL
jgi:putative NIF3 family GTP cyclohydrolase 1 type 2